MKKFFDETKTASLVLILVLTFSTTILALPIVSAHDPPWEIQTYAYITASPDPIGVGQQAIILFWVVGMPAGVPSTAAGVGGYRWIDMKVDVTMPNGNTQTLGTFTSDPIGGSWVSFTPTEVGTYKFSLFFPKQQSSLYNPITGVEGDASRYPDYVNDIYLARRQLHLPYNKIQHLKLQHIHFQQSTGLAQ
jgi:hypothetical protein